jgi:hypothetical protein
VPLDPATLISSDDDAEEEVAKGDDGALMIAEAKRRLAITFNVDPANTKSLSADNLRAKIFYTCLPTLASEMPHRGRLSQLNTLNQVKVPLYAVGLRGIGSRPE